MSYYSAVPIVIVASKIDQASLTLANELRKSFSSTGIVFGKEYVYSRRNLLLVYIEEEPIYPPDLDKFFNPYAYIFLSRHSSSLNIPSITCHSTGNIDKAKLGGRNHEIGRTEPSIIKNFMIFINRFKSELPHYSLTLEATHHGPTSLIKPCLFIEIGSTEKEWEDSEAAKIVCEALLACLENGSIWDNVALAIGGTHYPDKFNRILLETKYAISYVVPKYALKFLNENIVDQMITKSTVHAKYAILDWKGLGEEKQRVIDLIKGKNLEIIKI